MDNQVLWNDLHKEARHRTKYPAEDVIRFTAKNFRRDGSVKILDLGCGAGRHVIYLADAKVVPYGVDFSQEGVSYTRTVLREHGYEQFVDNVVVATTYDLPFADETFDGVVCWGVLYYLDAEHIRKSVDELYRVLKTGGKAEVLIRTTEDYRCVDARAKHAKEIEERTYLLVNEESQKSASKENGMLMHFFTREEVERLFSRFAHVTVDLVSHTHENGKYQDQDFLVLLQK